MAKIPAAVLGALLLGLAAATPAAEKADEKPEEKALRASDGVLYATQNARRVMRREALSGNLLENGSFERGRFWPTGWEPTDRLTTFRVEGGTDGERCLRIFTNVLDQQWKANRERLTETLRKAARRAGRPLQQLPRDPRPSAPQRQPTRPPYYDTVAGLHGVHYRSEYIPVKPRAVYRFSIDARCEERDGEGIGEPKVFIKGYVNLETKTREGVRTVRRDAYRAPIGLNPCDEQWRRYARVLHPWKSKSTLQGRKLRPELLQVQIYAYWKPGNYRFDNVRLEIVGEEEPEPEEESRPPKDEPRRPAAPTDGGFPVFKR
ncbi:MAG: hypothetical protein ACOC7T_02330 [Planctomycetota bacterium]